MFIALASLVGALACSDSESGGSPKAQVPVTKDLAAGQTSYDTLCMGCHGATGMGATAPALVDCSRCSGTFAALQDYITAAMPPANPAVCTDTAPGMTDPGNCAENTAAHIFCSFNPDNAEGCL
jgi:hypothetical protein